MKSLVPCFYHHWMVVIALSLITFIVFMNVDRYNVVSHNLLDNKFEQKISCAIQPCKDSSIKIIPKAMIGFWLSSKTGKDIVSVRQILSVNKSNRILRFTGSLKVNQVEKGKQRWQTAHLVAIGIDKMGVRLFHDPHFLSINTGTSGWQNYTKTIRLGNAAVEFLVEIQLSKVKGSVSIKGIELYALEEKSNYRFYWYLAVIVWFLVFAWILVTFYRVNDFANLNISAIALLIVIIIGALMPQNVTEAIYKIIDSFIFLIFNKNFFLVEGGVSYTARYIHFWMFALLALFMQKGHRRYKPILKTMALLLSLAIVIEVVQLLIDERNTELNDLVLDFTGIVVGTTLSFIWLKSVSFFKNYH